MKTPQIFHRLIKGEAPTIVLIHGMACDHTDWRLQEQHFRAQGRQLLLVDLRGHGQSMHIRGNLNMPTMAADVVELLRQYNITSAIVAGHSMGCRVATETALQAPDIIERVVLVDGSRFAEGDADKAEEAMRAAIAKKGFSNFLRASFESMFLAGTPAEISQPIIDRTNAWPEAIGELVMLAMVRWDAAEFERRYRELKVPITVLQSTHVVAASRVSLSASETVRWHEQLHECGTNCSVVRVANCGHFPMLDNRVSVSRLLAQPPDR